MVCWSLNSNISHIWLQNISINGSKHQSDFSFLLVPTPSKTITSQLIDIKLNRKVVEFGNNNLQRNLFFFTMSKFYIHLDLWLHFYNKLVSFLTLFDKTLGLGNSHYDNWGERIRWVCTSKNIYLSLNIFQYFLHSWTKLSHFLCHWICKLECYKCSLRFTSKEATQKPREMTKW